MTICETSLSFQRPIENVRTDVEEGSLLLLLLQKVIVGTASNSMRECSGLTVEARGYVLVRAIRSVVERKSPSIGLRTPRDISLNTARFRCSTLLPSPPAIGIFSTVVYYEKRASDPKTVMNRSKGRLTVDAGEVTLRLSTSHRVISYLN